MLRDVHFNFIYVVQSLPDNEPQTGSYLLNDTIKRWAEFRFEKLRADVVDILSKKHLVTWLTELKEAFHYDHVVPYLHFEIHGCKEGLVLKNGELVKWEELRFLFTEINYNIHNNLFISLATCYGAYIFQAIDILDRIPFYAFIGPVKEIKQQEVEADWTEYFNALLTTRNFSLAVEALNRSNSKVPYAFYTSEEIFDYVSEKVVKPYQDRGFRRERMHILLKRAKRIPSITEKYNNEQLKNYFKKYVSNQQRLMGYWKEYFLMQTDITPIERL